MILPLQVPRDGRLQSHQCDLLPAGGAPAPEAAGDTGERQSVEQARVRLKQASTGTTCSISSVSLTSPLALSPQ